MVGESINVDSLLLIILRVLIQFKRTASVYDFDALYTSVRDNNELDLDK